MDGVRPRRQSESLPFLASRGLEVDLRIASRNENTRDPTRERLEYPPAATVTAMRSNAYVGSGSSLRVPAVSHQGLFCVAYQEIESNETDTSIGRAGRLPRFRCSCREHLALSTC